MKNNSKGFTLIELLVVIAIIGILSTIVIASVSSSRDRAINTAIKENVATIRAQVLINNVILEEGYALTATNCPIPEAPDYFPVGGGTKFGDPVIWAAINKIHDNLGDSTDKRVRCADFFEDQSWAVSAPLKGGTTFWCVDSTGVSKLESSELSAAACT